MSYTNKTPHYNLPQYIGTDKPTYLIDDNDAYLSIDTAIFDAQSSADTSESLANIAKESADNALNVANNANTVATNAQEIANNSLTIANNASAQSGVALENANSALNKSTDALEKVNNLVISKFYTKQIQKVDLAQAFSSFSPNSNSFINCEYNTALKIMKINLYFSMSGTINLTDYKSITINGYVFNCFKLIKLPFTFSGVNNNVHLYSQPIIEYSNSTINERVRFYGTGCIFMDNGVTWYGMALASTTTVSNFPNYVSTSLVNSFNLSNLGNINLTDWTDTPDV